MCKFFIDFFIKNLEKMPILLIFPQFLLRNHLVLSVATTALPYRMALASIILKQRLLLIYLIYNIKADSHFYA